MAPPRKSRRKVSIVSEKKSETPKKNDGTKTPMKGGRRDKFSPRLTRSARKKKQEKMEEEKEKIKVMEMEALKKEEEKEEEVEIDSDENESSSDESSQVNKDEKKSSGTSIKKKKATNAKNAGKVEEDEDSDSGNESGSESESDSESDSDEVEDDEEEIKVKNKDTKKVNKSPQKNKNTKMEIDEKKPNVTDTKTTKDEKDEDSDSGSESESESESESNEDEDDEEEIKDKLNDTKKSHKSSQNDKNADMDIDGKKSNVTDIKKKKATENDEDSESESEEEEEDDEDDDDEMKEAITDTKKGFSDENSKWLKPKIKKDLLSSDEEDGESDNNNDNDEYDENASVSSASTAESSLLSIERESNLLDKEIAREKAEGEAEYQHMIATQTSVYQLPTEEEIEAETDGTRVISPQDLRERIQNILEVLADFKTRKLPNKSRNDYLERLGFDMAELFGYLPELVEYFLSMFGPHETMQFLEASDSPRPVVLRTNTLKARRKDLAQSLIKRGVNLDPLSDWSKVGLKIYESPVPLGATPEYLAGHYMLQSAASMCPVLALTPGLNQRVLDMSAAPGGKTSYIAQLMKNTGIILANDLKPERQTATIANMHRLGVKNTIVACHDGRKLGKMYANSFDRILLDAPCSGLGVISRDPSVKVQRTIADVLRTSHLQKELLLSAVDALNVKKDGGIMVYSTCSVSIAENEEVVDYLLRKRDVKLIDTGLDFGKPGFTRYQQKRFHPSLALTRRFYPHVHNMDGFYVCKIMKISAAKLDTKENIEEKDKEEQTNDNKMEENKKEKISENTDDTKNKTKPSKKKQSGKVDLKKKKKNGKRKRVEDDDKIVKKGKQNVSIPPTSHFKNNNDPDKKKKKSSTNAKVTKPRRKKVSN